MSIETEAVAEVIKILNRCPHLEGVIDAFDRVPFTDGHIDVYMSNEKKNRTWRARVPVQVKGRAGKRKGSPSFPMKREVLEAHKSNGGILLFCVDVDLKGERNVPRYAVLTPYQLRHILDSIPESQDSVSIPLSKLPRMPDAVERIVEVALVGGRQNPFLHVDPRVFENVKHIAITAVDVLDLDSPTRLDPGETAYAAEIVLENDDRIPLDGGLEITPHDYLEHERELRVAAGDAAFESVTVKRISPEETLVTLGEGLVLTVRESKERLYLSINITFQSNFVTRKRAIEFVFGVADHGVITIGNRTLRLAEMGVGISAQVDELRGHLAFLRRLQQLFEKFDIDGTLIDLDELADEDIERLRVLYNVFIEGASAGNSTGEPGRMHVSIGDWTVVLIAVRGEEAGTWRYIDPFDPKSPQMFRWAAESDRAATIPITAYDALKADELASVLNLRLDSIDQAYGRIAEAKETVGIANERMRALLTCADAGGPRREEFLNGADRLNEWIIRQDGELPVHLLNRWQIAWRKGSLTDADRSAVRRAKRESARAASSDSIPRELACALLLEEREESALLVEELTPQQRSDMEGWPIWELHRTVLG